MNDNFEDTDEFFSFLTGKAYAALGRRLQRNLKEEGIKITSEQWSVLYYLWIEEGRTQQELACLTFRDKPSVSRLINNLERLKLVIRVTDKEDKRTNLIFLTKQGRQMKEACLRQAKRTINQALEGVSREDMIKARNTLDVLYSNLS
ncbi:MULTISPECIES: MarR family winged helix-turn-helix transcriptional regulator [Sphingobacterium]|uniref:MarR family transcriptional regulator n=2 Tax=Sphingobacterium TaxID=28453 RepID=A0A2S9JI26_9SPHI|nr:MULTISPECIES: MarR family transcriptional regulator [Sphingobacterium]PRD47300.1 MarR family transcriptional regulator [Sphingobacterium haloxyli]PRD52670.1 MarR family transcriptional regulator [Sphingobacterium gobiense]